MNKSVLHHALSILAAAAFIIVPLVGANFPQASPRQSEFQKFFDAGKALYENGEHKDAIIKLLQSLFLTKDNAETAEACLYLALTYYTLGDKDNVQLYLKKLFEAKPEHDIDAKYFPVSFVGLFFVAKNEAAKAAKAAATTAPRTETVALSEVDVEPKLLKSVDPVYPAAAFVRRQESQVTMEALISESGDVLEIRIPAGADRSRAFAKEFEDSAKKALAKWKFQPALKGGIPVRIWKPVTIQFKLNR